MPTEKSNNNEAGAMEGKDFTSIRGDRRQERLSASKRYFPKLQLLFTPGNALGGAFLGNTAGI